MAFFSFKKAPPPHLENLHHHLNHAFQNVRRDNQVVFHYLQHLFQNHHQNGEIVRELQLQQQDQKDLLTRFSEQSKLQEQLIQELKSDLKNLPKSRAELKQLLSEITSYDDLLGRVDTLNEQLHDVRKNHSDLLRSHIELEQHTATTRSEPTLLTETPILRAPKEVDLLAQRIEKLEEKRQSVKEKIIQRIVKNTKGYIKNIILSYIKKYNTISALQLKEMVVHEQGLCSKSSFYRLLEELELEADIGVIKEGKEKKYIAKIPSPPVKHKKKK